MKMTCIAEGAEGDLNMDLIERQVAIDAIREDKIDLTNPNVVAVFKATGDFEKVETQVMTCDRHIKILKNLPSEQSAQQWIPCTCSERLPEPGEYYLVTRQYFGWNCTEYREIDIAKYDFNGWPKGYTVLAWCELPEPYKENTDG